MVLLARYFEEDFGRSGRTHALREGCASKPSTALCWESDESSLKLVLDRIPALKLILTGERGTTSFEVDF